MSDEIDANGATSGTDHSTSAEQLSLRGDELTAAGLHSAAVDAYKESIKLDATNPTTYFNLVRAYYKIGEYREADAALRKMAAINPARAHNAAREFYLSEMLEAANSGRFEEALGAARHALDYLYQGVFISPIFGAALQQLERIAQEDSDPAHRRSAWLFASYMSYYGYRFISLPEPKEPLYWYEQALQYPEPEGERDPLEVKIHYRAGMTYWRGLGNTEWWRPMLSEEDYWQLPQYEKACKAFERSIELYQLRDWGLELLAENIFCFEMLSACYIRTGRLAEGVETLRRGLALVPDNKYGGTRDQHLGVVIYNLDFTASIPLSEGYEKLGEYAAALECLVKPVDLLIDYEKYAEAIALVRRAEEIVKEHAVEISPKMAVPLNRLAEHYCKTNDHNTELFIRERILEIESLGRDSDDPQLLTALHKLAGAYAELDRWDEAEPLFKRALDIWERDENHDVGTAFNIVGALTILYGKKNNPEEAVFYGERALALLKAAQESDWEKLALFYLLIGVIHKKHGNNVRAEECLNQAIEIAMRERPDEGDKAAVRARAEEAQEELNEDLFGDTNTTENPEP